jgi:pimeloyl-ACP methyl ester carboxylesterase
VTTGAERAHTLTASDGVRLHALVARTDRPIGVMVLCHGLSTDAREHGAFPVLRDQALRAGLAVVRFDFRAHGQSGGENEQLSIAGLRIDGDAVADFVQSEFGTALPIVPLGVSFGATAAVHLAATRPQCAALALWYPVIDYAWNFGTDSPVPFTHQMLAAASSDDPSWSAMPVLGTSYYLPKTLVQEAATDPTPRTLNELSLPVLAYHGSRDKLVRVEPLRRIAAGRPNIELHMAYGAAHGFILWRPYVLRQTARWAARCARGALRS